jgi:hypothetical protein
MIAIAAMVATLLSVAPTAPVPAAEAAQASNFDPGNIISDEQFFDGRAMSADQVQTFLNAQLQRCATGYTCLKDYAQATPAMAATEYCAGIPGRSRATSSQIIVDVAVACDVSPRVLLVLLQKEQSLVTHPSPSAIRYERATGFACPDTAPCDSTFGGFYYQVYYAARQFQRYAMYPGNYRHRAGQTNAVLYHPNAACGSSPVHIRNQATAGLYNYTPYQPNRAALANLYGTGDSCSAYGNRNFWRMWSDWFGDPRTGTDTSAFLRDRTNGKVYLIVGSARHHVLSPSVLAEYSPRLGAPRDVDPSALAAYAEAAPLSTLVHGSDGSVLLVDNGVTHRFASCTLVQQWKLSCTGHAKLDAAVQGRLGAGEPIAATVAGSDGHDWLIQSGTRRELADVTIPTRYGYAADRVRLDPEAIEHLPVGPPVLDSGTAVRDRSGAVLRIKSGNAIVPLTAAQVSTLPSIAGAVFTDASLEHLRPSVAELPARLRGTDGAFLITDAGMLRVDPARYGGTASFAARTELPNVLRALPSAGSAMGPHFVREAADGQLYLASGPRLQPVADQAAYDFIRSRFGVPGRVWEVPTGGLNRVPKVLDLAVGDFVRGSDGRVLLWDGAQAMHLMHGELANALGVPFTVRDVDDGVIAELPKGPSIGGFGFRCASTDLVATGGTLRPYASSTVATAWSQRHVVLSAELCAQLTISASPATQFVVDPAGRTYLIEQGRTRYIPNRTILAELGGSLGGRTLMPAASIAVLPKGADVVTTLEAGTWVRGTDGRVFLWDGVRAMYLMHPDFATALGVALEVRSVSASTISAMPKGPWIGNYAFRCGSTDYLAFDGALHPFASPAAAAAWKVRPVELSAALCADLQVSTGAVTQFVYGASGRTYLVEDGRLRYIATPGAFAQLGGWTVGRTLLPTSMLDRLPKGTTI